MCRSGSADRYGRRLLKMGPPPAGYQKRKQYDEQMERLLDDAIKHARFEQRSLARWARFKRYTQFWK